MEHLDHGVLAQLVERQVRNLEARGSSPLCSTKNKATAFAAALFFIRAFARTHWPQNAKHFLSGAEQVAKQVAKRQASQGFEPPMLHQKRQPQ